MAKLHPWLLTTTETVFAVIIIAVWIVAVVLTSK